MTATVRTIHRRGVDERVENGSVDFESSNATLFERRRHLLAALADEVAATGELSRATRRVRRELDDVTSEIVTLNLGLVRSYCKRFTGRASMDDVAEFEAAGLLGLMRAIDSFEPTLGRFGSWAFKPIQREVLRAVRSVDHPNLNLTDFERRPEIIGTKRRMELGDTHAVTQSEVAAAVGVTVDQVRRVLNPPELTPIETPTPDGTATLGDQLCSTDADPEDRVVSHLTVDALRHHGLSTLDRREMFVIVRRFGLDNEPAATLAEIAGSLDLSREAVRQIESKALAKIRHPLVLAKIVAHERDEASGRIVNR